MSNLPGVSLFSTRLFARSMSLTIGFPNDPTLDVKVPFNAKNASGLDTGGIDGINVDFVIEKSLKPTEPNTCEIKLYNLAVKSRQSISGEHALTVRLEAGYQGGVSQLYFAEARSAWTTRDGSDFITHIESTDTIARPTGLHKTRKPQPGSKTGSLYRVMGPKVPIAQAFQAIAQVLGVGEGNLLAALANNGLSLASVNGSAVLGNGARRLTDLCRSAGLEWSIQDGNLQILAIGEVLSTVKAIELSDNPNTGIVGSPSIDSQGSLAAETLLIPGIAPGVLVSMNTEFVTGGYRVEKCRYTGSTRDKEWYCRFDAVRY